MSLINVVCVLKSGGRVGYDSSWVEKLRNSVSRNLTLPHTFICLSDSDVPCQKIPLDSVGPGYWAKIQLFKPGILKGPTLYLDLDTVICQNLDQIVLNCLDQEDFLMWKDTTYRLSSSALMYWNGDYSSIYNDYLVDPDFYHCKFSQKNQGPSRLVGDQALISTTVEHQFINDIVPEHWIKVIEKKNSVVDHSDTKILIFRKAHSKPSNMLDHEIVKKHWK